MKAFYAYPSSLPDVNRAIHGAQRILSAIHRDLELHLWEENDISGRALTDPIFEGIAQADIVIADITAMNFNVTFEIGYAIGLGKRVFLTRDGNFTRDGNLADRIGIFDTLGFETYTEDQNLSVLLGKYGPDKGIPIRSFINVKCPVYVFANASIQLVDAIDYWPDQKVTSGLQRILTRPPICAGFPSALETRCPKIKSLATSMALLR